MINEQETRIIESIFDILQKNNIATDNLEVIQTNSYVKISADKYYDFCRVKFGEKSKYIELTIWYQDAKRLKGDSRFIGVPLGNKRFSRIPITNSFELKDYADIIVMAYTWATKK